MAAIDLPAGSSGYSWHSQGQESWRSSFEPEIAQGAHDDAGADSEAIMVNEPGQLDCVPKASDHTAHNAKEMTGIR